MLHAVHNMTLYMYVLMYMYVQAEMLTKHKAGYRRISEWTRLAALVCIQNVANMVILCVSDK